MSVPLACALCGRTPVVREAILIPNPFHGPMFQAVVQQFTSLPGNGGFPALAFALCRRHARRPRRSAQKFQALVLARAARETVQ